MDRCDESPLDVLSRAAVMVQGESNTNHGSNDTDKSSKSPTKWKQDKRKRLPDYQRAKDKTCEKRAKSDVTSTSPKSSAIITASPIESIMSTRINALKDGKVDADRPLDMTVRQQNVSGSSNCGNGTCGNGNATKKRGDKETISPFSMSSKCNCRSSTYQSGISMCDPIIDEHFRRSLGKDYSTLYPQTASKSNANKLLNGVEYFKRLMDSDTGSPSVDDHFAKALGDDTWYKIKNGVKNPDDAIVST